MKEKVTPFTNVAIYSTYTRNFRF